MNRNYSEALAEALLKRGFPDIKKFRQTELTYEKRKALAYDLKNSLAAMDAENASNLVQAWQNAYFFPGTIEVFTKPLTAEKIMKTTQFQSFETPVAIAQTADYAGNTVAYGDFNRSGGLMSLSVLAPYTSTAFKP
jgi:hypothetical protein